MPKLFNLRMDPFERADVVSDQYNDWLVKNAYLMGWDEPESRRIPANLQRVSAIQMPASFTIDQVQKDIDRQIEMLSKPTTH